FFGAVPASFIINSYSQITAISPAGTVGPVDITVVDSVGTSATSSADIFTYVTAPPPPPPPPSPASTVTGMAGAGASVPVKMTPINMDRVSTTSTAKPGGDIWILSIWGYDSSGESRIHRFDHEGNMLASVSSFSASGILNHGDSAPFNYDVTALGNAHQT